MPVASAASRERPVSARDDRALVGRGEVGATRVELRVAEVAHGVEQRRLEPGEREVEPGHARDRERERLGVALAREPVDLGAAGVAEPEQPRALVERLAGGVVERRAEPLERAALAHGEQQRVPAAREQARERRLERVGAEVERRDVALQVVDRDERQPARPGDRLGRREPDEQRADQPRARA